MQLANYFKHELFHYHHHSYYLHTGCSSGGGFFYTYNRITWEAEAGRLQVETRFGIHSKIPSQKHLVLGQQNDSKGKGSCYQVIPRSHILEGENRLQVIL